VSSFGEGLKREREKKKITLDQVAVSTKVSVRMLRAIEEEKFEQLPGGIFNKGFVRAYARYLGIDEEKAVADYLSASAPAAPPEGLELRAMADQKQKERQRQARLTKDFPWGSVAVVLLLIALGFSIWGVISGRESSSEKVNTKSAAETSIPAPKPPQVATTAAPANAKPQLSADTKVDNVEDDMENEVTTRHLSDAAPVKPIMPSSAKADSFTVLVTAQENSWLSIIADGKTIFTGTLIAPGVQLVHATNSIVLRAGNLGGLEIDFNGKRLPAQGTSGEAKTLTFHSDGLEPAKPSGTLEPGPAAPTRSSENRE
jgi:cytoskeletal protein RodZ